MGKKEDAKNPKITLWLNAPKALRCEQKGWEYRKKNTEEVRGHCSHPFQSCMYGMSAGRAQAAWPALRWLTLPPHTPASKSHSSEEKCIPTSFTGCKGPGWKTPPHPRGSRTREALCDLTQTLPREREREGEKRGKERERKGRDRWEWERGERDRDTEKRKRRGKEKERRKGKGEEHETEKVVCNGNEQYGWKLDGMRGQKRKAKAGETVRTALFNKGKWTSW